MQIEREKEEVMIAYKDKSRSYFSYKGKRIRQPEGEPPIVREARVRVLFIDENPLTFGVRLLKEREYRIWKED